MSVSVDYLKEIVARKRREVERRRRRARTWREAGAFDRRDNALRILRRPPGEPPRVIAELKFRSPSAGVLRERTVGAPLQVAQAYVRGGASALSVLADRVSFGGSALDVRRVAQGVAAPVLFKEFVIDPIQVQVARAMGASFVLLIVATLEQEELQRLVDSVREAGLVAVVEAASEGELQRALCTDAEVVGINARDLHTFKIDRVEAARLIGMIPSRRIAVFMSGVENQRDFVEVGATRADAVLVGSALVRSPDPEASLRQIMGPA